jgi:uroporphyrinogen III methyltransferase/synthase
MKRSMGRVYLVGAGPGDPGLITVKGLECVKKADVIIYDYLANERLLDRCRTDAELIYVGKQSGKHTLPQQEINALIVSKAQEGKIVVRLKGGDPFIFGRGGEEAEELADHHIPFEVVPGVSAATAVPAYAGIPLTHRDHNASVAFVTGHEQPGKPESRVHWDAIAAGIGTIVIFMGTKNLPDIIDNLVTNGRSPEEAVAVIQWGTRTDQRVVTGVLKDIVARVKQAELGPPAIVVVGEVTRLRQKLNWYESKPLFGRRIVVTHSRAQSGMLADRLTEFGATVIEFPTIDVISPPDHRELDAALHAIETYDSIVFSSANSVRYFLERLRHLGNDIRVLQGVTICSVGLKAVEELGKYGLKAVIVPRDSRLEEMIAALGGTNAAKRKFLFPREKTARGLLPARLRDLGADVTVVATYEYVKPNINIVRAKKLFEEKKIAAVTFTSSSSVHHFVEILGQNEYKVLIRDAAIACLGPVTAKTAEQYGIKTDTMPNESTIPALIDAIVDYFKKK